MIKIKEELLVNMWMKKQMDSVIVSDSEAISVVVMEVAINVAAISEVFANFNICYNP